MALDSKPDGSQRNKASSPAPALFFIGAYVLLAILPLLLAFLLRPRTGKPLFWELGAGAALVGFSLMLLQTVVAARLKLITRFFKLDQLLRFHKKMGIFACCLILCHPILLALGMRNTLLFSSKVPWNITLGKATLALLVLLVLFALLYRLFGVGYRTWRFTHKGAIIVIIVGFTHSLFTGHDIRLHAMRVVWWILISLVVALFLYRNVLMPLRGRSQPHQGLAKPATNPPGAERPD
jgi:predicted ferric reductase